MAHIKLTKAPEYIYSYDFILRTVLNINMGNAFRFSMPVIDLVMFVAYWSRHCFSRYYNFLVKSLRNYSLMFFNNESYIFPVSTYTTHSLASVIA